MKKMLLMFLILVVMLATLASNGKSDTLSDNEEKSVLSTDESGVGRYKPLEGVRYEIDWCGGHQKTPLSDNAKYVLYLEEKFNVDINYIFIERSKWAELLSLRIVGGQVPDIMRVEGITDFQNYIKQEILMPVPEDVIATYAPNTFKLLKEYNESAFDTVKMGGVNYGLPRTNLNGSYNYAPVWRKDWLTAVGIDEMPRTLVETEEAFRAFRYNDPDGNGKKDTYGLSNFGMRPIYGAYGALPDRWLDVDGKLVYGGVYPGMRDALELLAEWYADGLIDPTFVTGEHTEGYWAYTQAFYNGIIGFTSPGAFYHINRPLYHLDAGGKSWKPFNTAKGGDHTTGNIVADETVWGIGYNPVGPTGFQGNEQWGFVEKQAIGFSYDLEEEPGKLGKILEIIDGTTGSWEGYFYQESEWKWGSDEYIVMDNGLFDYNTSKYGKEVVNKGRNEGFQQAFRAIETPQFVKRMKPYLYDWADSMEMFNTGGYIDALLVPTESQEVYWADLETSRVSVYTQIITGALPITAFDEFVRDWYAHGGQTVTDEANNWYSSK